MQSLVWYYASVEGCRGKKSSKPGLSPDASAVRESSTWNEPTRCLQDGAGQFERILLSPRRRSDDEVIEALNAVIEWHLRFKASGSVFTG
jgi:hypothetical protein